MPDRLLIAPEGRPFDDNALDPESLTWRTGPLPILDGDGEVVGALSDIARTEIDGETWLVAGSVAWDGEPPPAQAVNPLFHIADSRIEATPEASVEWVESGELESVYLSDGPGRWQRESEYAEEAAAVLAEFQEDDDEDEDTDDDDMTGGTPVSGVIVIEGEPTGDDRMIEAGALTWDTLPIPIIFDREDSDHTGMTVGRITDISRQGNDIVASGELSDSEDAETQAAVLRVTELLEEGAVGVSIALDNESAEIRVSAEAVEQIEEEIEAIEEGELPDIETDDEGRQIVARWEAGEELYVVTSARIRHVAIVDTPAFAEAKLAIAASGGYLERVGLVRVDRGWLPAEPSIQAHALAADHDFDPPPRAWFEMAEPDETDPRVVWIDGDGRPVDAGSDGARPWGIPLTITSDGQLFGHLASWQDCHTGYEDRCLTPPRSNSDYAWFHTGAVETDDGPVPTGRITVDTDHANRRASAAAAVGHYDSTGHAVADVHVVDGELGPWMSGWVRPWATAQQRHELTAHPPSGDWRPRGGSTELIGVLCVNVPGFPLPRSVASYRGGEFASLVASGLPPRAEDADGGIPSEVLERLARLEARVEADDVLRQLETV